MAINIKDLFFHNRDVLRPPQTPPKIKTNVPDQMWVKCPGCKRSLYEKVVSENSHVCPQCGHHFRLTAAERLRLTVDEGTFAPFAFNLPLSDPLEFPGYPEKIEQNQAATGLSDAVVAGKGKIHGREAVICVMDSFFIMGSMGYVVGETVARAAELATEEKLPLIIFTASGGARMQEGMVSLMQMAKISGVLGRLGEAGLLYITVITDPTTGGVTASFASLGDIIIAEKGALFGFAGKRVIEQTINQRLPEGFQTAEFAQDHGFVDIVAERSRLKELLWRLLVIHGGGTHE